MKNQKFTFTILLVMLIATQATLANPGGEGDADRDFTCGGSCHGDPGFNAQSSATITTVADSTAFAGTAYQFDVSISTSELSSTRLMGVFLLSSTNGNGDHPEENGWHIIQDSNGGSSNYVESVVPSDGTISLTWVLLAPDSPQSTQLMVEIHHGDSPNNLDRAYLGISHPHEIDVGPIPENLPGFATDWTAPASRVMGDTSPLLIQTQNSTSIEVLWMLEGESNAHSASIVTDGDDQWLVELPATMGDARLMYQVTTSNGDYDVQQPWLTIGTRAADFEGSLWGARLQSFASAFMIIAFMIAMQGMLQPNPRRDELDYTAEVEAAEAETASVQEPSIDAETPPPPPPGLKEDSGDQEYLERLIKYEEYPDLLWDPVEEEWVDDPNAGGDE